MYFSVTPQQKKADKKNFPVLMTTCLSQQYFLGAKFPRGVSNFELYLTPSSVILFLKNE